MEFEPRYGEDFTFKQNVLGENYLKSDFGYGFSMRACNNSKGVIQDIPKLDQCSLDGCYQNSNLGMSSSSPPLPPPSTKHVNYLDQVSNGNSIMHNFDIFEYKPFLEGEGSTNNSTNIINGGMFHQNKGFFNFPLVTPLSETIMDQNHPSHLSPSLSFQELEQVNLSIPDELSCITAENGIYGEAAVKKRISPEKRRSAIKGQRRSNVIKGQWTMEEDRLLVNLVGQFGMRKWSQIAQTLRGRIGKQCRERWHNHLRPNIKKDVWTEDEDRILIQSHIEIGNKWAEIAKRLRGRTENSIKNHWNATKRRQFSRRRCRNSKYPRSSSLLQNYIKSLGVNPIGASNTEYRKNAFVTSNTLTDANGTTATATTTNIDSTKMPMSTQPPLMNQPADRSHNQKLSFFNNVSEDKLVPNYDFNDVADFGLKISPAKYSLGALFDEMPSGGNIFGDDQNINMEINMPADMYLFMQQNHEVKREMDLVEMMNQTIGRMC
ncbi:hypothetical protein MKX01_011955 [Papaver californicum]|nr:hypothetical protein MKX01_011955 [Papaver californicum]